jgi:hypothetical protein
MKIIEMILAYVLSWKFIGPTVGYSLFLGLNAFFSMWSDERRTDARHREVLRDAREKLSRETAVLQTMGGSVAE